jgi:hypothetical protein
MCHVSIKGRKQEEKESQVSVELPLWDFNMITISHRKAFFGFLWVFGELAN